MDDKKENGAAVVDLLRRAVGVIEERGVYDTETAAAVLHRSPRWVAKMCASGRISGVNNNGWRIEGAALLAFLRGV